ncbi:Uncharacterized protein TCM_042416 [Theobroma cacao]|uniref:RNase H type-1 domain-containing protein n=1 Tax=Theobroma cacao TaxID=3641 RepID=A0A061FSV4_THECC|nr:Uncharacterized protein TCM_042416 [Theobroma cacao]
MFEDNKELLVMEFAKLDQVMKEKALVEVVLRSYILINGRINEGDVECGFGNVCALVEESYWNDEDGFKEIFSKAWDASHSKHGSKGDLWWRPRLIKPAIKEWQSVNGEIDLCLEEEVTEAIFNCDGNKAPRPDGFNFNFFKAQWLMIKGEVYFMSLFEMPKGVKEELDRIQRWFLWGCSKEIGIQFANLETVKLIFSKKVSWGAANLAKVMAIREAMIIFAASSWTNLAGIILEIDSRNTIQHIPRVGNELADNLGKLGVARMNDLLQFSS